MKLRLVPNLVEYSTFSLILCDKDKSLVSFTFLTVLILLVIYLGKIAGYKSELFANLRGKAQKVLEIGIGTGPNLRYYAGENGVQVFGVDPNRKMERYAKAAAVAAGLPVPNFKFIQAVRQL